MLKTGTLYICPTPIGNLEDITFRTIKTLKTVDIIACEDTRITQKLLNHYEIKTKLISYHKFSEKEKSDYLLNLLKEGNNIALVSDAGTPLVSDPGGELLKTAYFNNIKVVPLPGANAVTTALSASYLNSYEFCFLGFLPRNLSEKENLINKYKSLNIVFYESPNRIVKTLEELSKILDNNMIVIARELTKIYEEIKKDTIQNQIEHFSKSQPKGEFVVIIEASQTINTSCDEDALIEKIKILEKEGFSTKEISKIISLLENVSKSKLYNLIISLKKD